MKIGLDGNKQILRVQMDSLWLKSWRRKHNDGMIDEWVALRGTNVMGRVVSLKTSIFPSVHLEASINATILHRPFSTSASLFSTEVVWIRIHGPDTSSL